MHEERRTRAWIEVSASAVRRNLTRVADAVGPAAALVPMVKADGYGLGLEQVLRTLEPGAPWGYGVATVAEGRRVRAAGIERPVLVCSPIPPGSYRDAVSADLTVTLSDLDGLARLAQAATQERRVADFHVEVDTGMGRTGFDWRDATQWGPPLAAAPGDAVRWTGCFTHFHSADLADPSSVRTQWERFRSALAAVHHPRSTFLVHAANSAAALRLGREIDFGGARPGIFLYGGEAGEGLPPPTPVASVRARVVHVRDASPGTTVGYGSTHTATEWERWATLAIGYGDGLPRALGNRGHALVRGRRVPLVGRISMDVTVANISGVDGVEVGDVATLVGEDRGGRITVDEVADVAGTISYEILTGFTARLARVWIDEG